MAVLHQCGVWKSEEEEEEEEEFRPYGVAPSMNDLLEVKYNMR